MAKMIIPPKPDHVTWTEDQWKAIHATGQDILVAAAAGSGKTAVLVERIITKIISTSEPLDVDELLIVTFTNASAAEMRHRIGEALERAINENPTSRHLRKQLALLNKASISTLHSFSLEVIRKYYYKIDIDPSFRIADVVEAQLLRDEVMEELLEDEYGKSENEAFYAFVDTFSNDRSDVAVQNIIRDVYDFSRANPAPSNYLQAMVKMYHVDAITKMEELPFIDILLFDVELQLEGARQLLEQALELTKQPGGPAPRAENYLHDLQFVDHLLHAKNESWASLYTAFQAPSFLRVKVCKGDEYDKELLDQAQKLRDKAKGIVRTVKEELFSRTEESFIRDMKEMAPHVETLVALVESFSERFDLVKREKGLVDYSDLEHFCLQILAEETDVAMPSEAGKSYQKQFKEVFVDEYQDVNMVQESIIKLVTNASEENGNLFMVGDVKQSIYRFRLAEPNLFLGKYQRFTANGEKAGLKIDLAKNFRSRKEVLAGTNFLFKQLMGVKVGEIEYNQEAELVLGASYPPEETYPIELLLIDQKEEERAPIMQEENDESSFDFIDLEQSQLEARIMAAKIKKLISERKEVYNPKTNSAQPVKYRDIVILLRSMTWAPQIMEEFKEQGIPIYANLSTGYFEATEITIMMSLLKVIDNPLQDISLASVLRSPLVGLSEEELAKIRLEHRSGTYYEAIKSLTRKQPSQEIEQLHEKLQKFLELLGKWRTMARQGALSHLILQLYCDTRFIDFVGGLPGGKQRQANLRALYDRARQYEETSFRGLFRFLRFIERMRERGDDLGAARALGEQEDVVRLMTIHSSKGLEFPIVFVAGLARPFNLMDIRKAYMLDKELGFATKYIHAEKRISYPSLPQHAFKRKKKLEMLAEEMRVLYVALTRAKEKLYLTATMKDAEKTFAQWTQQQHANQTWLLKEYDRAEATSYLDWLGPALVRHQDCTKIRGQVEISSTVPAAITNHESAWQIHVMKAEEMATVDMEQTDSTDDFMDKVYKGEIVPFESPWKEMIGEQLSWNYGHQEAARHRSKQSVSEMKRQREMSDEESGHDFIRSFSKPLLNRPHFMQSKVLTPAERGTAMHMVMQHLNFREPLTEATLDRKLEEMVANELLTLEQRKAITPEEILSFFATDIGRRLIKANKVTREIPFSAAFPASTVYSHWHGEDETILVQGIIDCLFEDEGGLVLLDYKTDAITDRFRGGFEGAKPILLERYAVQIDLYARALEQILKKKIAEKYLFFFDGGHLLKLP